MIKFKDQDGLETEQSYDLDAKTTVEDLQEILKAAVQNLDQDSEYSFYHNTFEVRKKLRKFFNKNRQRNLGLFGDYC